ncbi:MAG: hypothetical protein J5684_06395, partial [Eubacterium sp.]|nr:hypothetical protein [Eubacterium sp.]
KDDITVSGVNNRFYMNDQMLGILYDIDEKVYLATYGLAGEFKINSVELAGDRASKYKILGCYKNSLCLGYDNEDKFELIYVDIMTGEQTSEELFNMGSNLENSAELQDGKLVYVFRKEHMESFVGVYDLQSKEKKEYAIPDECGYSKAAPRLYDKAGAVLYSGDKNCVINISDGNIRIIDSDEDFVKNECISENGTEEGFAIADRRSIRLVKASGEVDQTIECAGLTVIGMTFIPERDEFLVLFNDGSLHWYTSKGDFKRKTDVMVLYNFDEPVLFDVDIDNNLMYIQMDKMTDMVDMESGVQIAYIEDCFGHHKISDSFITQSYSQKDDVTIGYYKRYTVDELIEKAKNILQDAELSQELKTQYGIED